jgi:adenylylsulfate kinase
LEPITSIERRQLNAHGPAVLWFTGLSGSGKSTIATTLEHRLLQEFKAHTYLLDGDSVRTRLNKDLDFSDAGRNENIRRIGEVSRLFFNAGLIVLTAFISPFRADRALVRSIIPKGGYIEIFVRCPLSVCEQRDPKGLYRKARGGQIPFFTGIDSAYEEPESPELVLDSASDSAWDCSQKVIDFLHRKKIL